MKKEWISAKAVGALLPDVTRKVYQKKGFPNVALLTEWPAIVGPELAAYTCPEKMTWPKRADEDRADQEFSTDRGARRRGGARGISLKLRVEGHKALEVQYIVDELIERINRYFGYRAVTEIRILQGPVNPAANDNWDEEPAYRHLKFDETIEPSVPLDGIEDEGLRVALLKLDQLRRAKQKEVGDAG